MRRPKTTSGDSLRAMRRTSPAQADPGPRIKNIQTKFSNGGDANKFRKASARFEILPYKIAGAEPASAHALKKTQDSESSWDSQGWRDDNLMASIMGR